MTVLKRIDFLTVFLIWQVQLIYSTDASMDTLSVELKEFHKFTITFNKSYKSAEEQAWRFEIFKSNLKVIEKLNSDKHKLAKYKVTVSSDLTPEEFRRQILRSNDTEEFWFLKRSRKGRPKRKRVPVSLARRMPAPPGSSSSGDFSWVYNNPHYPPAESQGNCGACSAFAVVGAMAILYSQEKAQTIQLSKQQLIDCDDRINCDDDGVSYHAINRYLMNNYLATEEAYPYRGTKGDQPCDRDAVKTGVVKMSDYSKPVGEEAILEALRISPLPAKVIGEYLRDYDSGIITNCPNEKTNHAITIVGAGVGLDENGVRTPYYMIRNTWGSGYGIGGHAKIKRGTCNIEKKVYSIKIKRKKTGGFMGMGGKKS